MQRHECVAMLLAGGQGSRLGGLTFDIAKPAMGFGGKYRLIDFSLSNCYNSGIEVVGVLTQYKPMLLNAYIGTGAAWALDSIGGGVSILPPYMERTGGRWYNGTADAVYQNLEYIDYYDPDYVVILSGDHVYKMDYSRMLFYHKKNKADVTIATINVPLSEASRFGLVITDESDRVTSFVEKPVEPKTCKASMGVYVFNWQALKEALIQDHQISGSDNDFGRNIIPALIEQKKRLFSYGFDGYWRDVGTIDSYFEANMDLLDPDNSLQLGDATFPIYSNNLGIRSQYIGPEARVKDSLICDGCTVLGEVTHSILSNNVYVGEGAKIHNSIILQNAYVESNVVILDAIVAENMRVEQGDLFGNMRKLKSEERADAIQVISAECKTGA